MSQIILFSVKIDYITYDTNSKYVFVQYEKNDVLNIVKSELERDSLVYEEETLSFELKNGNLYVSGQAHKSSGLNFGFL